jgi:hypothetical protein
MLVRATIYVRLSVTADISSRVRRPLLHKAGSPEWRSVTSAFDAVDGSHIGA